MIPKIIHYCWFGRNPLPNSALKCIESWKKYFPDYEIKEWNEDNFDVNSIPYTAEAYAAGKYAFVSDYARFKILYEEGGIYFDTDVEVIKSMDDILSKGPFMGFEKDYHSHTRKGTPGVAPGLGLAAYAKMDIYSEIIQFYQTKKFILEEGTVVTHTTTILRNKGLVGKDTKQMVAGLTIYPSEVFCPMDSTTGMLEITPNTVSIHHYSCSWIDHNTLSYRLHLLKNQLIRLFGRKLVMNTCAFLKKIVRK